MQPQILSHGMEQAEAQLHGPRRVGASGRYLGNAISQLCDGRRSRKFVFSARGRRADLRGGRRTSACGLTRPAHSSVLPSSDLGPRRFQRLGQGDRSRPGCSPEPGPRRSRHRDVRRTCRLLRSSVPWASLPEPSKGGAYGSLAQAELLVAVQQGVAAVGPGGYAPGDRS
jgi:hypothetical protein